LEYYDRTIYPRSIVWVFVRGLLEWIQK